MKRKNLFPSLAMLTTLFSCTSTPLNSQSLNSDSKLEVMILNQIVWEQLFAQPANNYLVYVYAETCSNCQAIKDEVIAFALEKVVPLFFVDINNPINEIKITHEVESSYGATSCQDVSILGTPTLIEIYQGVLIANVAGTETCLTLLHEKRLNIGK